MYNFKDKAANIKQLNAYMLAKTIPMFEYEGLPETIPYRNLEILLQRGGFAFITEVEGKLYAFTGGLGGVQDVYGNPTEIVIANPALNFNATLNLEKDGVLIRNDDLCIGLLPLFEKYNTFQVENDINLVLFGYNTRLNKLISASDDKTRESAERYVAKAIDGDIAIIGENAIFEGVKLQSPNGQSNVSITGLLEYQQYIKASLYNEVGLSANFNMKRERLVSAEVEQGEDSLFPFVYSMAKCRIDAIKAINEKYGTKIKVDFGSVWYYKHKEFVDNIVKEGEANEQQLENSSNGDSERTIGNSVEKEKEIADIQEMLKDESLSDEDKAELQSMLDELEGKQNEPD